MMQAFETDSPESQMLTTFLIASPVAVVALFLFASRVHPTFGHFRRR
jgi:hypothetical protein